MFCPVCCQRWAPLGGNNYTGSDRDDQKRVRAFESNEVRVCGDPECQNEQFYSEINSPDFYFEQVEKVKKYLEKNPTANRMEG